MHWEKETPAASWLTTTEDRSIRGSAWLEELHNTSGSSLHPHKTPLEYWKHQRWPEKRNKSLNFFMGKSLTSAVWLRSCSSVVMASRYSWRIPCFCETTQMLVVKTFALFHKHMTRTLQPTQMTLKCHMDTMYSVRNEACSPNWTVKCWKSSNL